jgi:hypothetical protein
LFIWNSHEGLAKVARAADFSDVRAEKVGRVLPLKA